MFFNKYQCMFELLKIIKELDDMPFGLAQIEYDVQILEYDLLPP